MPRFGLKALLILFAVAALWLATFIGQDSGPYGPGNQIRKGMLLVVFLASGVAAVCYRGRTRVFWSGFFATMLLLGVNFFERYTPSVNTIAENWTDYFVKSFGPTRTLWNFVFFSMSAALVLGLSAVVGFIAAYIYDQSQKQPED